MGQSDGYEPYKIRCMMLCRKDSSPAVGGLAEFRGLLICARITILWKQNTIMSHGATGCPNATFCAPYSRGSLQWVGTHI